MKPPYSTVILYLMAAAVAGGICAWIGSEILDAWNSLAGQLGEALR